MSSLSHTANVHWLSVCLVVHMLSRSCLYSSHPLLPSHPHTHKSVLYVCISAAALQIGSSVLSQLLFNCIYYFGNLCEGGEYWMLHEPLSNPLHSLPFVANSILAFKNSSFFFGENLVYFDPQFLAKQFRLWISHALWKYVFYIPCMGRVQDGGTHEHSRLIHVDVWQNPS